VYCTHQVTKSSIFKHDSCLFQALARLRFSETVAQSDVDEALRLMQMSKYSLYSDDRQRSGLDAISDIYSILRDEAARTSSMDVKFAHALNLISRKVQSLPTLTSATSAGP
jgi:DNA replicative helicase MCM subunit Mcm2 (Cdc46/Mcm family)